MRKNSLILMASCALALVGGTVSAQQASTPSMDHKTMPAMARGEMKGMSHERAMAMNDYMAAMKTMDKGMMAAKGSTPDLMFARKMIAHHQGAIDMSRVQLKYGADAEAKRLAQKTIDENTKAIAELQMFVRSHGG